MSESLYKYRDRASAIAKSVDRELALRACDAYESIIANRSTSSEAADPLIDALRSRARLVLDIVGVLIADLAVTHAFIRERLLLLMQPGRSSPRAAIVVDVLYWIPNPVPSPLRETVVELCRLGLKDRSWRVRRFAAERAVGKKLKEVLPALKQAFEAEVILKKRHELEHEFVVLRDGYILDEPSEGDRCPLLTIYNCYDRIFERTTLSTGFYLPPETIERLGISEIVRRLSAGEKLEEL